MTDLLGSALALVERGVSMQEAEFYDAAMTGDGEPAMLPYEESPWLPVYREAARFAPNSRDVVDLGCGTGRFAAYLLSTSFAGSYLGLDFSHLAVAEARAYVRSSRATFEVADLRSWQPNRLQASSTFICLEVLEHLEHDRGLIRALPAGSQLVFSVPSYMSASHVRCFPQLGQVFARYGDILDIRGWRRVDFSDTNIVHVCDSVRRAGIW